MNLTGYAVGSTANLFLTSGSTLFGYADVSGYNSIITPGALSSLATAGLNTAFRGIGLFAPVPEPSILSLGLVAAGLLALRKRRA